ncbi:hypothetical protein CJF30_00000368 [Rutstroemia sp. NJR-2017a BBW]|nr:hypothetical protein CJF30_00000368 [Rutstroemia sp. NJR-2017a BBW]
MPVVTEHNTGSPPSSSSLFPGFFPVRYVFLSGIFFLCVSIYIRRKRRTATQYLFPPSREPSPIPAEKTPSSISHSPEIPAASQSDVNFHPQAFTPAHSEPRTTPPSIPLTFPLPTTSPEFSHSPFPHHHNPSSSSPSHSTLPAPPRRRSYTRPHPNNTNPSSLHSTPYPDLNGEILIGDGWRRHTKVFGGGVCEACAESERRMSA